MGSSDRREQLSTSLAIIETMTGAELFKPGTIDPILDKITAEVRATPRDMSTEAGRKAIASLAFKVAKSKTFIDALGKAEVEADKQRIKLIDRERSRVWDKFEALQKEVRQPLTEWENTEKARVDGHERELSAIADLGVIRERISVEACGQRILSLDALFVRDWQEFSVRARAAHQQAYLALVDAKVEARRLEDEQEELARLRAEQAMREQREREERIAREAVERERVKQEEERRKVETARFEAEARAKQIEAAAVAAKEKAERDAVEAEARRAHEAAEAEARAERAKDAAVEAERARQDGERKRLVAEAEAREQNRAHAAKINREVVAALMQHGFQMSEAQASEVVRAIAKGLIPNTRIIY